MNTKIIKLLLALFSFILLAGCMSSLSGMKVTKKSVKINKTAIKKLDFFERYKQNLASMQASNYREVIYHQVKNNSTTTKLTRVDYNSIDTDHSQDITIRNKNGGTNMQIKGTRIIQLNVDLEDFQKNCFKNHIL